MAKIRNFAEIAPNLPFTEYNFYEEYRGAFEKTELGWMKKILPLHEMAKSLGLVSESLRPKRGRRSYFTPEGKVALMFKKSEIDKWLLRTRVKDNTELMEEAQRYCATHPLGGRRR